MGIFSAFLGKPAPKSSGEAPDQVIQMARSIVVREDLIQSITDRFAAGLNTAPEAKNKLYIQTYLALEEFIIQNRPMVVQRLYTKESLREEIRSRVDLTPLPDDFRLLFLPEKEQLFLLYSSYTEALSEYIISQVGGPGLHSVVESVTRGTPFSMVTETDEDGISEIGTHLKDVSVAGLTLFFQKLNAALYETIAASFGDNTAREITQRDYQRIKEIYNYDLISQYLRVIPPELLDKERVTYMTRDDLEKRAIAVAEERFRREMAEASAKTLQEEKLIIEEKVKEQTREINEEKEALKKAVAQMNSNFLQAQKSEAKLLASVKGLSLGFILTDAGDSIITINTAARAILKLSGEVHTVRQIETHMDNSFNFTDTITECRSEIETKEFKEVTWNDTILHITISPIFFNDPQTEYIGTVILIDDVTEEKRLERTKDEFFAIASHELRTPLTAIRGSVSILKNYYADKITEGDVPKLIGYIDKSSDRLIDIVNEFLNVSRLEQGRIEFKKEPFAIGEVISEVVHELANLADRKQLYLRYPDEALSFHPVFADKERTKQVLVNLIGNAIKFTKTGGVTVHVEEQPTTMLIKVSDTGSGISGANQRLLFRKFQQAEDNILTHDASKGTGLGLYISKKLIENMGGSIYLESSRETEGSTFTFTLPLGMLGGSDASAPA